MRNSLRAVRNQRWILLTVLIFVAAVSLRWLYLADIEQPIFDEVHYVPAAEVLVGLKPHPGMGAWSFHPLISKAPAPNFEHPLLGKFLIGLGLLLWGDEPWGWRFFPALFGSLSLLLLLPLARDILQKPPLVLLALTLLGFDSMAVLQSRLAMLDIFMMTALLALLWASFHLIQHLRHPGLRMACAVIIALGLSIKWVFAFAILGFCCCILGLGQGSWKLRLQTLVLVGCVSLAFYHLWYFYYAAHGFSYREWLEFHWVANQLTTGKLAPHPYEATAFSMLRNSRAIWYYYQELADRTRVGLVCLMNPLLIFSLLPAVGTLLLAYARQRRWQDVFILSWLACCYLPFYLVLLERKGFLYYMLLPLPLIILAVCRMLEIFAARIDQQGRLVLLYALVFLGVAAVYLPLLLACPMSLEYYSFLIRLTGT